MILNTGKNRWIYLILLGAVIFMGLSYRNYDSYLHPFIAEYAGETLWGLMFYLGFRFIFVSINAMLILVLSVIMIAGIEYLQFFDAQWMDTLRSTKPGMITFSHGFEKTDIWCYLSALGFGAFLELIVFNLFRN